MTEVTRPFPKAPEDEPAPIEHDDRRRRRAHEPASPSMSLNMTPMIDVVFLLLVYFVLGSSFRTSEESIVLELPERLEGAGVQAADPFELPATPIEVRLASTGDGRGEYSIGLDDPSLGGARTVDELRRVLSQALVGGGLPEDQEFSIRPERDARWEHAIEVLGVIRASGFVRVRLVNPAPGEG